MRRFRLRKTGEIVSIISYVGGISRKDSDKVSFIDSNGNEHANEHLNYYWDFEEIGELDELRCKFAGMALQGMLTRSVLHKDDEKEIAEKALKYADALIEVMQKPVEKEEHNLKKELEDVPIGSFFTYRGKKYTPVKETVENQEEGHECDGCAFHDDDMDACTLVECSGLSRKDKETVIFVEASEEDKEE